jgi:hypothetical protein
MHTLAAIPGGAPVFWRINQLGLTSLSPRAPGGAAISKPLTAVPGGAPVLRQKYHLDRGFRAAHRLSHSRLRLAAKPAAMAQHCTPSPRGPGGAPAIGNRTSPLPFPDASRRVPLHRRHLAAYRSAAHNRLPDLAAAMPLLAASFSPQSHSTRRSPQEALPKCPSPRNPGGAPVFREARWSDTDRKGAEF